MKMGYTAFNLTTESRQKLLNLHPAKFENIIAHHVTYEFKVPETSFIPQVSFIKVIGYAFNDNIECIVVEVNGTSIRKDGKLYHITISHNANAKPVDSNSLLLNGYEAIIPFELEVLPTFNAF